MTLDRRLANARPAAQPARTAAELFVQCLEAEGCEYVFSVPGEETMDVLEALADHPQVRHITTRHEQGAAFMADVYGRLTGRCAVAMATLGPGATNLVTGVADAYLDRAPMVVLTGQVGSDKLHKEAHQLIDIVELFGPITKWNERVERIDAIPEIVRKAFRHRAAGEARADPHRAAREPRPDAARVRRTDPTAGAPVARASRSPPTRPSRMPPGWCAAADRPILLAGNGVLRRRAAPELRRLAQALGIPVAVTFMGKGAIDDRDPLSLMAVGLQARDHVLSGFDRADLVICVGYDAVEYAPDRWNPDRSKRILAIDTQPAEVDASYQPEVELVGDIGGSLSRLLAALPGRTPMAADEHGPAPARGHPGGPPRQRSDEGWPIKPQKAISDLRRALAPDDLVICDVGAHKVWIGAPVPGVRAQHGDHQQRLRGHGHQRCRAPSPPRSSIPTARSWRSPGTAPS